MDKGESCESPTRKHESIVVNHKNSHGYDAPLKETPINGSC